MISYSYSISFHGVVCGLKQKEASISIIKHPMTIDFYVSFPMLFYIYYRSIIGLLLKNKVGTVKLNKLVSVETKHIARQP